MYTITLFLLILYHEHSVQTRSAKELANLLSRLNARK